jgi:predicted DNA-binding transcriptional regulator AlpA
LEETAGLPSSGRSIAGQPRKVTICQCRFSEKSTLWVLLCLCQHAVMRQGARAAPLEHCERLVNRRQLRELVPVSDMTIWRWEKAGLFPRHISINGRNYWRLSEISVWFESVSGC